jgi:uncharacterized protein YjbI with pentapeptide repeats
METCRFKPCCNREADANTNDGYCILHSPNPDKDKKDFYKALDQTPTGPRDDFSGFVFPESNYFEGKTLNCPTFARAKFMGRAGFRNAKFIGYSNFQGAEFADTTDFANATFSAAADFEGAGFTNDAWFFKTKFESGVSFKRVAFRGKADFYEAEFGKEDDGDDGDDGITQGSRCSDSASSERANFRDATFEGQASFTGTTFACKADFPHAKFNERSYFSNSQFKKKCKEANFWGAQSAQQVNFVEAIFENGVEFTGATFEKGAYFRGTIFLGRVNFLNVRFLGPTVFAPNTLFLHEKGEDPIRPFSAAAEVFFIEVTVEPPDAVTFKYADLRKCCFQGTDLRKAEIIGAKWPEMDRFLPLSVKRNGIFDEKLLLQGEKIVSWSGVEQVYRQLKQNFEDRRDYERAGDFHYGEKEMRRKNPETGYGLKLLLYMYWLVSGYGEKALRPLVCAAGLLLICTFAYFTVGVCPKGGSQLSWTNWSDWPEAALYSFRVMTLLKPDELGPISDAKILHTLIYTVQSIAGPVLLGLFGLALRQRLKR